MDQPRPHIFVTSADDADVCTWVSDGWFAERQRHTKHAQALFAKAKDAIAAATDVPDAIKRLREAGFDVTQTK